MSHNNENSGKGFVYNITIGLVFLCLIGVMLTPAYLGSKLAASFVNAQRASCDMTESFGEQLGDGKQSEVDPSTAENCKISIESTKIFTYIVWILITYIGFIAAFSSAVILGIVFVKR